MPTDGCRSRHFCLGCRDRPLSVGSKDTIFVMDNNPEIGDMVTKYLAMNAAAIVVLAVLSYVSSVLLLAWLESLEKWWNASERKRYGNLSLKRTPNEVPLPTRASGMPAACAPTTLPSNEAGR